MKNRFYRSLILYLFFTGYITAQETLNPKALFNPTPFGFSHSSTITEPGRFVFIAGQSGADSKYHYSSNFRMQVRFSLEHLNIVLKEYDLRPENIVKITVLIVNHSSDKLTIWSEEAHEFWSDKKFPTSTLIPVPCLASQGMLFEVDAIAFKADK